MNECVSACVDIYGKMHSYRIFTPGFSSITLLFLSHGTQAGEAAWGGLESYRSGGLAEGQRGERTFPQWLALDCKWTLLAEDQSAVETREKPGDAAEARGGQGCRSQADGIIGKKGLFLCPDPWVCLPSKGALPFLSFFLEGL